jgi:hypothetical protein
MQVGTTVPLATPPEPHVPDVQAALGGLQQGSPLAPQCLHLLQPHEDGPSSQWVMPSSAGPPPSGHDLVSPVTHVLLVLSTAWQ